MEDALLVKKIENGTVIDHIPPKMSLTVARILKVFDDGNPVLLAINVESKKMKRKDILKLENRFLSQTELGEISLLIPGATVNKIENWKVVDKQTVELPDKIEGIVRCANPACVTNKGEPVTAKFTVISREPLLIRCHYCRRDMDKDQIMENLV